jgi:hypothetical protein
MAFDRGRNHIWVAHSVSWLAQCLITFASKNQFPHIKFLISDHLSSQNVKAHMYSNSK